MPDVYNSSYTGTQIDAAIGAVKNKETTWDNKQDKLTGTQGQVVGFDDDGDAIAMPAPDTGVTTFNNRTGAVTPQAGDYTAAMVGARADDWMPDADDVGAVPVERTINGQPLSSNVTLDAGDVGARADTWMPSADDVGAIPASQKGVASGVAELDGTGRVPSTQLPSYVDDVLEYTSLSAFPPTGEDGKIYIAEDTNRQYRWSGSQYVEISPSLALGETSSTAYRGDRGKTAYDHSQTTGNPHNTTAAEVGAVSTSTTINGQALTGNINLDAEDVGARPSNWMPTATDIGARPNTWTPTAQEVGALPVSGGTLTGALTLNGAPTNTNHAATKAYVDGKAALVFTDISVTTSMSWSTHSVAEVNDQGFTQRVTVPMSGITLSHIPIYISFDVTSRYNGNWSDYCDTYNGGLYLYAKEAMAATIESATFVDSAQ